MPKRNVLEHITTFNRGRDPELLGFKYCALRSSPLAFFRGTNHLFYQDWRPDRLLDRAPAAWICGDLHVENFGSFKGDNRLTYFDINDFDEAVLAPCTWELARLLVSVLVAAKALQVHHRQALALCHHCLDAYQVALRKGKAHWIERATAQGMVKALLSGLKARSEQKFVAGRTTQRGGHRVVKVDGKRALPASEEQVVKVRRLLERFVEQPPPFGPLKVVDVARRIAGTGSLGIERYVILAKRKGAPNAGYLLDLKHEPGSALAPYVRLPQPRWASEAERVVSIQQRVQAESPAFLSAVTLGSKSFVLRELLPSDDRLQLESGNGKLRRLEQVMTAMGQLVAWGNLRSGGRQGSAITDEWIDFGKRGDWGRPLLEYAQAYGHQVLADWQEFSAAYDSGLLPGASPVKQQRATASSR